MIAKKPTSATIKNTIIKTLNEHKASDITALNVKSLTDIATYMIIATANSTTHVKTLTEKTREKLAKMHLKPIGIEGAETQEWMLVDLGDVIVHIMLDPIRKFYDLEKLWAVTKKIKKKSKDKKPRKQPKSNVKKPKPRRKTY